VTNQAEAGRQAQLRRRARARLLLRVSYIAGNGIYLLSIYLSIYGTVSIYLSMESYGRLGRPAMQLLQTLAAAAASSATAGSDVTTSSFVTGALRELGVALVKGNEVVYREALHVYATAGGTAARVGATVPTGDPE
jgi:hypothetical protein